MGTMRTMTSCPYPNDGYKDDEEVVFVYCAHCGNEQPDMGHNVACEACGYLMPTQEDERGIIGG